MCPTTTSSAYVTWQGSNRRSRLPADWTDRRAQVLARDQGICHICLQPGADQVDHLRPGDDHRLTNLAAIHARPCHATKSALEGLAARGHGPTRKRPPEQHPGLTGTTGG